MNDFAINFMIASLFFNFFYMITVGIFGLFVYALLVIGYINNKAHKSHFKKLIDRLSYASIVPSMLLFLTLILSIFNFELIDFVFPFFYAKNIDDFIFWLIFSLLWWMPAIFLLIKKYIMKSDFYIIFSLIWYGIVMICLCLQIYSARKEIFSLLF